MKTLKSAGFDELEVGSQGQYCKTLGERDISLFGDTSGDVNPVHFDDAYASGTMFTGRIDHGMWSAGLISTCIGTVLPGPGSIYLAQELKFKLPVRIGDSLTAIVTVKEKNETRKTVLMDCLVQNQGGKTVVYGEASVKPPATGSEIETAQLPKIDVEGLS
jgi:acyl dehydratase